MAQPIAARVLTRPCYDNTRLVSYPKWLEDNQRALVRYFDACDQAIRAAGGPVHARDEVDEFDYFCRTQFEREAVKALSLRQIA